MVERDASVLSRVGAFVVLAAAVVTWDAVAPHVDEVSLWPTVAVIAAGVMPATLGLILLALPLWSRRWIVVAGAAFGVAAVVSWELNSHLVSNFAKLANGPLFVSTHQTAVACDIGRQDCGEFPARNGLVQDRHEQQSKIANWRSKH